MKCSSCEKELKGYGEPLYFSNDPNKENPYCGNCYEPDSWYTIGQTPQFIIEKENLKKLKG